MVGGLEAALSRYFDVLEGNSRARYLDCSSLDDKLREAYSIMESCHLCERCCGINRLEGQRGFCGVLGSRISSEFMHLGEEPELVPSYTIFFAGCTFKCVFCQNWDISQNPGNGVYIKPEVMARMIESRRARNVNWVGGDPTPNLAYILEVLLGLEKNVPQVWNSNMYLSTESMDLLSGVIDVYLTDFKYGCDDCALKYSAAPNYWSVTTRNHLLAADQAEVIIRHLVLPGHVDCCSKPVLDWIASNLGSSVRVNVMDQYRPEYKARQYPELNHRLGYREYREARGYAEELGLNLVE